jgi:Flp pilus assembly pilin Flp
MFISGMGVFTDAYDLFIIGAVPSDAGVRPQTPRLSFYKMKFGRHVMKFRFLRDDEGQDLIEYTLLLAFVALASAALFIGAGGSIATIWNIANAQLSNAGSAANAAP